MHKKPVFPARKDGPVEVPHYKNFDSPILILQIIAASFPIRNFYKLIITAQWKHQVS